MRRTWPCSGNLWPPVIEYADSLGVKVGIENCPMIFTNDEWPGGTEPGHFARGLGPHVRDHPQLQLRPELRPFPLRLAADGLSGGHPQLRGPVRARPRQGRAAGSGAFEPGRHHGHAARIPHPQVARIGRGRLGQVLLGTGGMPATTGPFASRWRTGSTSPRWSGASRPCPNPDATFGSSCRRHGRRLVCAVCSSACWFR